MRGVSLMPGLLDFLFGGQQQQQQPQYSWMPPQQQQNNGLLGGMFNRLGTQQNAITGYLSGALLPGTTNERIARGLAGMNQGAQTDIMAQTRLDALRNQREQRAGAAALIDKVGSLTPEQKRFFADNPKAWEEYSKALVSPATTTIGQTVLQNQPFGTPRPVYVEPYKPDLVKRVDPATGEEITQPYQLPQPHGFYGQMPQPQPRSPSPTMGAESNAAGANSAAAVRGATGGNPTMGTPSVGVPQPMMSPGAGGGFYSAISPQRKEEMTTVGAQLGKDYSEIQRQSVGAMAQRQTFQRMRQLNRDPNLGQGALAPMLQGFRSALVTVGGDPSKVKVGEEFTSLANQLVLDATGGSLGAQISNSDREFITARFPQLQNTREGRAEMIETLERIAQRRIDIAKEAVKYRSPDGPGRGSLEGFQSYLADWSEQNPLFADREMPRQAPRQLGTITPSAPSASGKSIARPTFNDRFGAATSNPPIAGNDALAAAREAINRGAPRDAVIRRLQQNGINPAGL
jgi:hypothetical protein